MRCKYLVLMLVLTTRVQADQLKYPVRAVTMGPKHHFFGYYDITPWDKSGRFLLANEVGFVGRQPKPGEKLTVGYVDLKSGKYRVIDKTQAWCWQQGCRLQWVESAAERLVIYNTSYKGKYAAVVRDIFSGRTTILPRPVYALSRDGKQAVTLDFARLNRLRPGYGYDFFPDKSKDNAAPKNAGIYWMDVAGGKNKLIISVDWASKNKPDKRFTKKAHHWFNHLLFNPSGTRFIFLHRWQKPGRGWWTRMYTAKPDGSDIQLVVDDGMVSHFDWRDDHTILAWARIKDKGDRFYLFDIRTGKHTVFGEGVLKRDGHCSYGPDRNWVLNDTYPDQKRLQTLMLIRPMDGKRFDVGKFFLPKKLTGPWRCDLHPRWSRDGRYVCIDSGHEKTRQMYVIDVGKRTAK